MKHASRDSLLSISSSSSSNRRSSLLSQENSITEECEDDVFEDDDERSTLPEEDVNILDNDEVEISTNFEVDNKAENMDESRTRISSASSIQSPLRPIVEEAPRLSSIGSNISPFSLASTATATPSPLNATPMSWPVSSPTTVSSSAAVSSNAEIQPSVSESSMLALPSNVSFVNPSNVSAVEDSPVFDNSNLSINMNQTPIFNLPPNVSFDSDKSENEEIVANEADEVDGELRDKEVFEDDPVISAPEPVASFSNNFMLPTASSLGKMVAHNPPMSPSPRKNPIWMPPSPSPSKLSIGKINSSNKRLQAVSRLPQLIRTPQSQPRPVLTELVNSGIKTPSSIQKKSITNMKSAYAAVASPVASYVRNNPAPHLVQ